MKKLFLVCCLCTIGIMLFGCAQQNEDEIQLDEMKASEIISALSNLGYPISGGNNYDEPGDPSLYPWNIPGCTSAAEFWIPDGTEASESLGYMEVYNLVAACKKRRDDSAASSSFFPAEPYYIQVGKVFLQLPRTLSELEADQYQAALQAMAQGKLPEPYTAEALNTPSQWTDYIETFPEYVYTGTKNATFADRHFELKDAPQNIPEELVTLQFYYNISGEYDKLYDLAGSESMRISATNTEKNFKNGQYTQEYIVRQLSTLSLDEFVKKDPSILEIIKRDILANKLIEYTCVEVDHTFTTPPELQGQSQLSDGDYTFYYLCGKSQQDSNWKLYEVYWE